MSSNIQLYFGILVKFFFMLTPFFVMSIFLSLTEEMDDHQRSITAFKVTLNIIVIGTILFWFGKYIFLIFGITLDSFRVGAGVLLFITAIKLVNGEKRRPVKNSNRDFVMVPLTIPVTMGPAVIGLIFVQSAMLGSLFEKVIGMLAIISAQLLIGVILWLSYPIKKLVGEQGIATITKLTGLMLSAIAAQIIFTGIKSFLKI